MDTGDNNCNWHGTAQVTYCGPGSYVYKLDNAPGCNFRYCASDQGVGSD